ncbi:MAG: response regulator transcription factor [Xenococcaceae cyanobacterium MO_207.B15]|nr:response regulator transcription factor [Xenococcaceae cyanobacterium MO_207.B15]MDJ0747722.1 response regulator transcription factor [Xenococcaceae cyanobacterium MO_167.B27]
MNYASEQLLTMSKKKAISLVIIDDNWEFRKNLKTLLELYSENNLFKLKLISDTDSIAKGKLIIEKYKPQVLLLDLELQQESGLDILKYLSNNHAQTKTLILSGHEEDEMIFQAMSLGAKGYIFKPNVVSQLLEAINTIINSKIYLPPEVATGFFLSFNNYLSDFGQLETLENHQKNDYHLTHREKEVLGYLVQGLSNEEIAQELYVTIATVKAHLSSIFSKFCVKNRTQAIVMALKENII